MRLSKRLLTLLSATALFASILAGCGGQDDDANGNAQTETLPAPQPLLERSVEQITEAESIELEMDVTGYPVKIDVVDLELPEELPLYFKYARGTYQAPDRIHANIQFSLGNFSTTADLIALNQDHYFRGDLLTANRWINAELIPGFSPAALLSPEIGIPFALASITGLQIIERTRLRGIDVFHLTGSIQASAVHTLTLGMIRSKDGELSIEVYISANDNRVAQIKLLDPAPPNDSEEPTTWYVNILDYNQEVSIDAPTMDDD